MVAPREGSRPRQGRRLLLALAVVALSVGLDQGSKAAARAFLAGAGTVRVIGSLLVLRYAENPGAFLSLGSTWHPLLRAAVFGLLSLVIVAAAAVYLVRGRGMSLLRTAALALVVGGGIGNLIDRLARGGAVTDFLNLGVGRLRTGIFNLADLFLLAGAALFLLAPGPREGPRAAVEAGVGRLAPPAGKP